MLHPKSSCYFINENNYVSKIKSEYEATVFAAEFLIDDLAVDQLELNGLSLEQVASSYYECSIAISYFLFNPLRIL